MTVESEIVVMFSYLKIVLDLNATRAQIVLWIVELLDAVQVSIGG